MRELTAHKVNGLNDALKIEVLDEPGSGGANHAYDITGFDTDNNPSSVRDGGYRRSFARLPIVFQNGPIQEAGANGVSNEALVAIVIDRLQGFQKGRYSCRENALALTKLEEAMHWMLHRTRERMSRGVEGTTIV